MKLHRFTASTNQKAIAMVHETLGPDALVYSTRNVPEGVEIVAGITHCDEEHHENKNPTQRFHDMQDNSRIENPAQKNILPDMELFEKLNSQLQFIKDSMKNLSTQVDKRLCEGFYISDDEQTASRNTLYYHLNKYGFKGKFIQQFINNYFTTHDPFDPVTLQGIEDELAKYIETTETDSIDGKNICALIGPTGIGKTTTILKLAKRHIAKYGAHSLGIITTDYHDYSGKNLLLHYQNLYHFDLEYADTSEELTMVLQTMKNKKLILIDTHGVSQRDKQNVAKLLDLIEVQGNKISPYLVLPCNVQEQVLDQIASVFKTTHLSGCILTKQDECMNIAIALSVAIQHKMKIAYVCNGQNINTDIECADKEKLLAHVMNDQFTVFTNPLISDQQSEGRYDR